MEFETGLNVELTTRHTTASLKFESSNPVPKVIAQTTFKGELCVGGAKPDSTHDDGNDKSNRADSSRVIFC